ncbi:MAG TPA: amidohydrolase family protein [Clostridiales bacterium]|nr:amidohydrolase family protein [Clostridiales bacterium]
MVVVEGSKFTAVGKKGEVNIPKGDNVEVVDTTGLTVMPGLIETHIHSCMVPCAPNHFGTGPVTLNKLEMLTRAIPRLQAPMKMGFTTVRDGGSGWGWYEVALRDAIKRGDIEGPRFQATGYHLTVTGGHGVFVPYNVARHGIEEMAGYIVDGPDEWRQAARLQFWNGTDYLKTVVSRDLISPGDLTISSPTLEELKAAVEVAKAYGKKVFCHASGKEGVMKAIEADVDIIVHGFLIDEECATLMAEKNIYWEPTNAYCRNMYWCATDQVPEKFLKMYPNLIPEWAYENSIKAWEDRVKNFYKIVKNSGVKVLMGSDAGCTYVIHGLNAMELEAHVQLGMSPREALLGCTKYAAESCGIDDKLGSVEVGKLADLVLVDGNPLDDITVLQEEDKIKMVMMEGEVIVTR